MNKVELTEALAAKEGMTKAAAARAIDTVIETIQGAVAKGDDVAVVGFGRFVAKDTAARKGRNPATGVTITIPAKRVPRFIPGASFRAAVAIKEKKGASKKK